MAEVVGGKAHELIRFGVELLPWEAAAHLPLRVPVPDHAWSRDTELDARIRTHTADVEVPPTPVLGWGSLFVSRGPERVWCPLQMTDFKGADAGGLSVYYSDVVISQV